MDKGKLTPEEKDPKMARGSGNAPLLLLPLLLALLLLLLLLLLFPIFHMAWII